MSDIRSENLTYRAGDTDMHSYIAWDAAQSGPRPGVLVAPEWWGLNDYIRERARQVADLGYAALALDMYGEGRTAGNPTDANAMMTQALSDPASLIARFKAGMAALAAHPACDGSRLAGIGYCFGGAVVLNGARQGLDLKGVVSFHGSLGAMKKAEKGGVKAKMLVCHGAADQFVPEADVEAFKKEMADAGVDMRFIAYPGALHGFTSPEATANGEKYGLPLKYDPQADQQSWGEMQKFLGEVF